MSCPDDSSAPIACNRQPFLSDDGCDRGSVDIHRFSALPFCDTIDPTLPEIPDEILDTPMQMFIPPPCVCVNMNYDVLMKYRKQRDFVTKATFKAVGDCCDGNYKSDFKLEIPCPVVGNGPSKRISMKLGYGTGGASAAESYIANNPDKCTIEPRNVDFDLHLPCPVKGAGNGKITASIKYGNGAQSATASFIEASPESCAIKPLTPRLDLNIPCPVAGQGGDKKIKASIKYGTGAQSVSVKLAEADVTNCAIKVAEPDLDLNLPCPVKGSGNGVIKASIKYGTGAQSTAASFIEAKPGDCTIKPLSPNLNLNIPCPVQSSGTQTLKVGVAYGGNAPEKKSVTLATTNKNTCAIDISSPDLDLKIPCPVQNEGTQTIAVGVAYGGTVPEKKTATLATTSRSACTVNIASPDLDLKIPCPIQNDIVQKLSVGVAYGNGAGLKTTTLATASKGNCTIKLETPQDLQLNIKCPIQGRGGDKKIKASVKYGTDTAPKEVVFLSENPATCTIAGTDATLDLSLKCPFNFSGNKTLSLGAKYATQPRRQSIVVASKDGSCELAVLPSGNNFDLELKCPFTFNGAAQAKFSLGYGDGGVQTANLFTVNQGQCTVAKNESTINLTIPCPVPSGTTNITTTVSYGGDGATGVGTGVLATGGANCSLALSDPDIHLQIPCPIKDETKSLTFKLGYGAGNTQTLVLASRGENCKLNLLPNGDSYALNLPCPISGTLTAKLEVSYGREAAETIDLVKLGTGCSIVTAKTSTQKLHVHCPASAQTRSKIRIEGSQVKYKNNPGMDSASCASFDNAGCTMRGYMGTLSNLQLPCPTSKKLLEISTSVGYTTDSTGEFLVENDATSSENCKRTVKLKIKFPKKTSTGGASFSYGTNSGPIWDWKYNLGTHKIQVRRASISVKGGLIVSMSIGNWVTASGGSAVAET